MLSTRLKYSAKSLTATQLALLSVKLVMEFMRQQKTRSLQLVKRSRSKDSITQKVSYKTQTLVKLLQAFGAEDSQMIGSH